MTTTHRRRAVHVAVLCTVLGLAACGSDGDEHAVVQPDDTTFQPSIVQEWNELALHAVSTTPAKPTIVSRQMFMLHTAIYDAWSAYSDTAVPVHMDPGIKAGSADRSEADKAAAVSQAAYQILIQAFPDYERNTGALSARMATLGYPILSQGDSASAEGIGFLAAEAVLKAHEQDGSNAENGYAEIVSAYYPSLYQPVNSADPAAPNAPGGVSFDANHWQPLRVPTGTVTDDAGNAIVDDSDPNSYTDQSFLTPHWGAVVPFSLTSPDQFRPGPPPALGSEAEYTDALGNVSSADAAYIAQFDQVLAFSANLSDREKVIAEYWADGPRTESPPGHWNQLAHGIGDRDRHGIDDDARMYFALTAAIFDTGIAVWETKRHYDFIRPASAIRNLYFDMPIMAWGGPNQGTQVIHGQQWRPYQALSFVTPPFAEYVSGHSAFSAAGAEVLKRYSGSDSFYDGVTVTSQDVDGDGQLDKLGEFIVPPGGLSFEDGPQETVILRWPTLKSAADEAAISRLYGGIHIQDGDRRSRLMGEAIGAQAFELAQRYWTGQIER